MSSLYRIVRLAAVVLAILQSLQYSDAFAQFRRDGSTRSADAEEMVLLTYEVGDLAMAIADYRYGGAGPDAASATQAGAMTGGMGGGGMGGGMGGGFYAAPAPPNARPASGVANPSAITMADLERVLVGTVVPSSWGSAKGESQGKVQPLGTSLVVWQTKEVHAHIENLLQQLRAGSGERKSVQIDARWLLLNSTELDMLMGGEEGDAQCVDRGRLDEFTRRSSSLRGITTCFSSQLVYLVSGTRRNFVSSYIPVVGSLDRPDANLRYISRRRDAATTLIAEGIDAFGRSVGYMPIVEKPNFGALLEIRPTLMIDEESAVVDVRSTITVPGKAADAVQPQKGWTPDAIEVDRIAIETQELATTCRVRLDQPALVGGITYISPMAADAPESDEDAAAQRQPRAEESPQLYLFIELRRP